MDHKLESMLRRTQERREEIGTRLAEKMSEKHVAIPGLAQAMSTIWQTTPKTAEQAIRKYLEGRPRFTENQTSVRYPDAPIYGPKNLKDLLSIQAYLSSL